MDENRAFRGITPTTKFWLLLVQSGEGCDYTVGCGVAAQPLKAQTLEDARVEARDHMGYSDYLDPKGHQSLTHVVLVTGCEFLPLDTWRTEYLAERAREEAEEQRKKDEAELERLQRKLGKDREKLEILKGKLGK